ncbi:DUF4138 domain-containing protein [Maribacter flavus]|uniref:DUF4138 domain-containing protein n=1 Tax=Maribacter flavus TaxID=1658664 RepID=A0A5B2TMZ8_9FLAO|nr:DUF4138 domain-containing protein [Maribacter flavus]KAA2215756.1 DUF4138 domain-containing protein [Maribacter flavus]
MTKLILLCIVMAHVTFIINGQNPTKKSLDTIEVSRGYKTILSFPETIVESIVGNEIGFVANVPQSEANRFHTRILKLFYDDLVMEEIPYTNLHVITESGLVYDFMLRFTEKPKQLSWYITPEMASAHMDKYLKTSNPSTNGYSKTVNDPTIQNPIIRVASEIPIDSEQRSLEGNCAKLQFEKARIHRYFSRADQVYLWLKGIFYQDETLYFQFRIVNDEGLDLDVNFIKFHIATEYDRSPSNQRREVEPIYVYKLPQTVSGKSENHFIAVFEKFALDKRKTMLVELDEASGSRNLSLSIGHELINNPVAFK